MTDDRNLSTEHQPKGAGLDPSDTLDKPASEKAPGTSPAAREDPADEADDPGFAVNGE